MPPGVRIERTVSVAPEPEALWSLVADTDRVNEGIGLPPVQQRRETGPDGRTRLLAHARLYGIPLDWEEKPYEWIRPHWYEVERVFTRGLLRSYRFGVRLKPGKLGGTEATVFGLFLPRYAVAAPLARLIGGDQVRRYCVYLAKHAEDVLAARPVFAAEPAPRVRDAEANRIARLLKPRLSPELAPLLDELVGTLERAADRHVVGMRPFAWADARGHPRLDSLRVFLEATVGGLLDMEWALLCPHCRGRPSGATSLAELGSEAECPSCAKRFAVELDRSVEARFTVAPAIRSAQAQTFCIGSPMRTPHLRAQLRLPPLVSRTLDDPIPVGAYRLRFPDRSAPLFVRPWNETATADDRGLPEQIIVGGAGSLTLAHGQTQEALVAIEETSFEDQAATAAIVASLPAYRRLFATDVIAPGQEIGVRRLTFMFSDLKGSTALYQQIGDARAFALVREHFAIFERIINAHEGTLVKTVGDAVMAVFLRASDAVTAAQEAHAAMPPKIHLRIGVHSGAALAVQLNNRNDFFGTTVNLAARLEHEAESGQTVVSEDAATEIESLAKAAREPVALKGIDSPVTVIRLKFRPAKT